MSEVIKISFSGPAFSLLLYENLKAPYEQEGFLLGEIVKKETKTITDNDQHQLHILRTVKINSCVPWPQGERFYDGVGRLKVDKIKSFLGDLSSKVVAWYKYKNNFNFTFREKIVHKQLSTLFDVSPELFTCCRLSSESSNNNSTYSSTQKFVRCQNSNYEQLELHIVNLSDPNKWYLSPEPVSDTFNKIIQGLKIDNKSKGLTIITNIQNAAQKYANSLANELAQSEEKLINLESEIKTLRELVKKKRESDLVENNLETSPNTYANMVKSKKDETPIIKNANNRKKSKGKTPVVAKSSNEIHVKHNTLEKKITAEENVRRNTPRNMRSSVKRNCSDVEQAARTLRKRN